MSNFPEQEDCNVTEFRVRSWVLQALKGEVFLMVKHPDQKRRIAIKNGILEVKGKDIDRTEENLIRIFQELTMLYKNITVDDHIYLFGRGKWDKYRL
ncbi:MAG: hypothetical protein WBG90_18490 [Saonia sp.]